MRPDQTDRIATALDRGYQVVAGDFVTAVKRDHAEVGLLTLMYDDERDKLQGLVIDQAGERQNSERELVFLKSLLAAANVDMKDVEYFLIDGERWDFAKNEQVKAAQVPIAGIHNQIVVRIRYAVELESTAVSGAFSFGE